MEVWVCVCLRYLHVSFDGDNKASPLFLMGFFYVGRSVRRRGDGNIRLGNITKQFRAVEVPAHARWAAIYPSTETKTRVVRAPSNVGCHCRDAGHRMVSVVCVLQFPCCQF
jgi:hypothetical protein